MTLPLFLLISTLGAGWTVFCLSLSVRKPKNRRTHRLAYWMSVHNTLK